LYCRSTSYYSGIVALTAGPNILSMLIIIHLYK